MTPRAQQLAAFWGGKVADTTDADALDASVRGALGRARRLTVHQGGRD